MTTYLTACPGDQSRALDLYTWNAQVSAAYWQTLGHLEVALRNTLATQLQARHLRLKRAGSWLDDRHNDLDANAKKNIGTARGQVSKKRKPASDGQTIAELSFGFWRFLLTKKYNTTLWPDLAQGFPRAPNRSRQTIEGPVKRLHEFRNRLAHHEPIWNKQLAAHQHDIYTVLGYIDEHVAAWTRKNCRISDLLLTCPVTRPHP